MTFIAWSDGAILRVPAAWTAWRVNGVAFERADTGAIVAFVGQKWRTVEQWTVTDRALEQVAS